MTYRYQWLVETIPSNMTSNAGTVFVHADISRIDASTLSFWAAPDGVLGMLICAFGPGEWKKVEITEVFMGVGDGMFPATEQGREDYAAAHPR